MSILQNPPTPGIALILASIASTFALFCANQLQQGNYLIAIATAAIGGILTSEIYESSKGMT